MTLPFSDSRVEAREGTIALGPDLTIAAYQAMERWHSERIGALALYCSDGRWGEAFDEFCHRHLRIPRYDRWAVPGGPACVAAAGEDPALLRAARIQLDFLVESHGLERIVLIAHYGCAWYAHRLQRPPLECLPAQTEDLQAAAATLRNWYPGLQVEAYLAMCEQERMSFHEVDLNGHCSGERNT